MTKKLNTQWIRWHGNLISVRTQRKPRSGEAGFIVIGLLVVLFVILLILHGGMMMALPR